tara:strand:+ start:457 stop:1368 length:912 start_codon:yes stop_codon:yes gene_type:complete
MPIDDRQLRYFVDVATFRSINKAAEHRNIAQPALSRRMRQLEHDLGVKLFNRSNAGISLTEAGGRLLEHAAKLIGDFDRIGAVLRSSGAPTSDTLSLGMPPGVSLMLLDRITRGIYGGSQGVLLQVREGGTQDLLARLLEREIDIAIVTERDFAAPLDAAFCYAETLFFVAGPGAPEAPAEVALPFALPDLDRDFLETAYDALTRLGRPTEVDMFMATISSIKLLVARGLACTIGPYSALIGELDRAEWNFTAVPEMPLKRYVVWRRNESDSPAIARSIRVIQDAVADAAQQDTHGFLTLPSD